MSLPDRSLSCTLIHKCNEVSLPLSLSYRSNLHLPNSGLLAMSLAARAIKAILNLLLDVDHDHFIKELRDLLYPVWQNQSFEIHQRCKKGTLLSRKLINGQAAVHQWCATLAYPTLSVSSRNLENQHTNTVNDFISIWVCLDQVIRFVVTSLGDKSRGFQIVQGVDQMFLQKELLHRPDCKSNLDCSPLCKCKCTLYILSKCM